ncbi:MAG: chromosomal replication initiator protein [Phycisphaerales bacterium]
MAVDRCHETQIAEETRENRTTRGFGRTDADRPQGDRRQTGGGAIATASTLRASIVDRLGPGPAGRYFGADTQLGIENNRVTVRVPNGFLASQIERRYGATLNDLAKQAGADSLAIEVTTPDAGTNATETERTTGGSRRGRPGHDAADGSVRVNSDAAQAFVRTRAPGRDRNDAGAKARSSGGFPAHRGFPAHHRFGSFVVGRANRVAYEAARSVACNANPGGMLLIHGLCGVGKTHLLHAVACEFLVRHPGARVRVTSGERFIREYVMSVRNNTMAAFQKRHRELDLLCIDDVHAVAGKAKTQIELVQTLKALGTTRAQIALVSDEAPAQIEAIDKGLVSRLSGGLVVRLDPPEPELRARIARAVGERRRLPMSEAVCRVIAQGSVTIDGTLGGVRELEGLVLQTEAIWRHEGGGIGEIGIETAARAVAARGGRKPEAPPAGPLSIRAVVAAACREVGVEMSEFTGRTRVRRVVLARSLAVLVARKHTNLSFPEIARAMQRNNHSTVITQLNSIEARARLGEPLAAGCPLDGLTVEQAAERIAGSARRLG